MTRIGHVQRQVLLCLMDGEDRTAGRIDMDMMMYDQAYGALRGLWRRGLVDRAFDHDEITWHLTRRGNAVAGDLFPEVSEEP